MIRVRSILVLVLACLAVARVGHAQALLNEVPQPLVGLEMKDRLGSKLPLDLEFTDSVGRRVRLGDFYDGDRPVIIVMMYLRCPLQCPTVINATIAALNNIEYTLGEEYRMVVVSFDPRDTPAEAERERQSVLLGYDRPTTRVVKGGLSYLTSGRPEARALADGLGFPFKFQSKTGEFSHGSGIFVTTPDGRVSRFLNGLSFESKNVRLALLEASEGQIGTFVDKFIHWCYAFDPASGSYTLAAFRVMRIGAILSALLLGGLVAALFVAERKRRHRRAASAVQVEEPAVSGPDAGGGSDESAQMMGQA